MNSELIGHVLRMNLAAAAAVGAVLALRGIVRTRIGARAAYGLWLAVPAAMLASLLPARVVERVVAGPAPIFIRGDGPVLLKYPAPMAPPEVSAPHAFPFGELSTLLTALWIAGVMVFLVMLAIGQRRAMQRFGSLTPDRANPSLARAANAGAGPALVGIVRPRLVLPADFEARFDASEQAMILVHEQTHLKGGDALINAVVALLRAVNWFNPLIHLGARRLRVDQELACDAAVVGRFPGERRTYARALLKTQLEPALIPLGCAWPGGSSNLLRERIEMLASTSPSPVRLFAGAAAVAVLSLSAGLAAWSAQAPQVRTIIAPQQGQTVSARPQAIGDPIANLASDVSAVFATGDDPHILINEDDHGVVGTRSLAVGEVYRDGWRLTFIQPDAVILSKDGQSRTVALEGRKDGPATDAPAGTALARVSATNAGGPAAAAAAGPDRVKIQAAIASGDPAQVMSLGGSAADVLSALSANPAIGTKMAAGGMLPTSDSVHFASIGGRTALMGTSANGGTAVIIPPQLADVPPPADAQTPDLKLPPNVSVGGFATMFRSAGAGPDGPVGVNADTIKIAVPLAGAGQ